MLYMFRTVLVHHQEQLYKLYTAFGICRYHRSGCSVAIATQQPDVSAYTGIYQMRCTAYKRLLMMTDLQSPKHVEHLMENKV